MAVRYLEQYCEKIYDINEKLEEISAPKAYKAMENFLIKAENEVRHMPVRREVVFLPYKASMWDSLESVYLAAKEDDTMDVYVDISDASSRTVQLLYGHKPLPEQSKNVSSPLSYPG